jgi:multicomponent Na+:H+ antiporter subunit G
MTLDALLPLLASLSLLLGLGMLVVAAVGLFTLPDALSRQHAATKAGTLAVGFILLAVGLWNPSFAWWWRILAIMGLLMATLPVASHLLARAAVATDATAPARDDTPRIG